MRFNFVFFFFFLNLLQIKTIKKTEKREERRGDAYLKSYYIILALNCHH